MAVVTTRFYGQYEIEVDTDDPTVTISITTQTTDDSFHDNTLYEFRQEYRRLPSDIIKFIELQIDTAQADEDIDEIALDVDLDLYSKWDNQLDKIFQNHRKQERWILSRDIDSQVRELRLERRTTPITIEFPLAD